jgi:DNA-binding NarL/FixJ family response regulator
MIVTVRQQQIIAMAARGMSGKEIARELRVSSGTVKWHLATLYRDLGLWGYGSMFTMLKFFAHLGIVKL